MILRTLCENVKNNANLYGFRHIDIDKQGKEEENQVEEAFYAMMSNFKYTTLEFPNLIPKSLYDIIEKKWYYCLNLERQIRKTTLAQVMPELTKGKIAKVVNKYVLGSHLNTYPLASSKIIFKMLLRNQHKYGNSFMS